MTQDSQTLTAEQMQDGSEYTVTFRGKYVVLDNELVQGTGMVINNKIAFLPLDLAESIASLPSPPVSGEAAAYMLIYPGCECGPTESCESVAYQKLAESPPGTELRPVYFHPSPLTNKPVGVTIGIEDAESIIPDMRETSAAWLSNNRPDLAERYNGIADRLSAAITGEKG